MAEMKFEDALRKLEEIVDELEGANLNLDDAIKKYEEGMRLSGFCYKKLQEIQKRVEILVKDSSGKLSAKEFSETGDDGSEDAAKEEKKPSLKKKRPKGEEFLFG